jgi:predicted CXXCH cytochrome family protein
MTKISLGIVGALLCLSMGVMTSVTVALAADIKAGEAVYQKACRSCHGADGTANPSLAKMLKVDIKDLKSPEVQAMSVADIKKVVTEGKGKMRPVTSVTGSATDDVAEYVKTMKK